MRSGDRPRLEASVDLPVTALSWHAGGCHCGGVRFEVALPAGPIRADACNCSMCERTAYLHIIVPESHFALIRGGDQLIDYGFNTGVARHLFCRACGIKSFYRPRSNPDGWSVNARCLDNWGALDIRVQPFDGKNWEANAGALATLSVPELQGQA